ncbi:unnamed protein product [Candida verbasci]|uniref:AB hydrolase-1 domain-containing protein n=1 Tax=Candida verbasci TaxID=1227364 RepID=A0A9W4TTL8_9ASCO|nr:unnamed protein product [Candida verbasci]
MQLYPNYSPYYEYTLKIKDASNPRKPGSVVLSTPSHLFEDYQLKIAYRKYKTTKSIPTEAKRINFIFLHGNGMNKSIWHYHIDKLFTQYELNFPDLYIDTIIAPDHVNMGDSCFINKDKLGHICDWEDLAKDYIMICKIHERETFLHPNSFNVIVSHSMSGYIALNITNFEPNLFQSSILINPIVISNSTVDKSLTNYLQDWYNQGYIKYNFDNIPPNQNWYELIYQHYTNKSFYKYFEPIILRNMIEDEIPNNYQRSHYYNEVDLKHNGLYDFVNYSYSINNPSFDYDKIKVPTKIICGDKDLNSNMIVPEIKKQLAFAKTLTILKNQYHNMHAQSPDLIISSINKFVVETFNSYQRENDKEYYEKYGKDYKQILMKKKLSEFLNNDKIPTKL